MMLLNKDHYRHHLSDYEYSLYEYEQDPSSFINPPEKPQRQDYLFLKPVFSLGYRYQEPGGDFVFRIGMGFPVLVHLGLGFAF